jgi:hypothetical protein
VTVLAGHSLEIRQLAAAAVQTGGPLLAGHDPRRVGLLVLHPDSPVCPGGFAGDGKTTCAVLALPRLRSLMQQLGLRLEPLPRDGFTILLVGAHEKARLTWRSAGALRAALTTRSKGPPS